MERGSLLPLSAAGACSRGWRDQDAGNRTSRQADCHLRIPTRGDLFVAEGYDSTKREAYYRPLGGTIHFGEHSRDAIIREIWDELGQEMTNLRYLGALENIFTFEDRRGHEIVLVYEADFVNRSIYDRASTQGTEDGGITFTALWKAIADFQRGEAPLYPEGLLQLLAHTDKRGSV